MSSSNSSRTTNIKRLLQDIRGNTFLHDESTDTSLQPGEQYPITPHSYMVNAYKQRGATVNQITELLQTKPSEVSPEDKREYNETELLAAKWLFPYTVDNPIGTHAYQHWKTAFNLAILQIVTQEFQKDRRITKKGSDLLQRAPPSSFRTIAVTTTRSPQKGFRFANLSLRTTPISAGTQPP